MIPLEGNTSINRKGVKLLGLLFGATFQQWEMNINKWDWLVRYWVSYHWRLFKIKWTLAKDVTEGTAYIRWDVRLIASKILCTSKIPALYNIKSQVGENRKEHWYPDRKVQNKFKNWRHIDPRFFFLLEWRKIQACWMGIKLREGKGKIKRLNVNVHLCHHGIHCYSHRYWAFPEKSWLQKACTFYSSSHA